MPRFLIERDLPGTGSLPSGDVRRVATTSNHVLASMAPRAQRGQSYVTSDKVYCVYVAEDEATLREHAARVGVPVSAVYEIMSVIDPTAGEWPAPRVR